MNLPRLSLQTHILDYEIKIVQQKKIIKRNQY